MTDTKPVAKTMHPARSFLRGLAVGSVLVAGLVAFAHRGADRVAFDPGLGSQVVEESAAQRAARLLSQTAFNLEAMFYRDLTDADVALMLNGALMAIDDHGGYVAPEFARTLSGMPSEDEINAQPHRVGVLGTPVEDAFIIDTTAPGSPADRAGLRPGDKLASINGETMEGKSGQEAFEALVAAVDASGGVPIRLGLLRAGAEVEAVMTPERLPPFYVYDMGTTDGVVHIVLVAFYPGAADGLKRIVERAMENGATGVVLDARANVGGRVDEAMAMLEAFVPKGTLAYIRQARSQPPEENRTAAEPVFGDVPVAVLIDRESASASEILASALQAHRRGLVVGQRSYGKGSIQTVYPVDASGGAVKMTIGFYTDPLNRRIDGMGVEPNVAVDPLERAGRPPRGEADAAFDAAAEWIRSGEPVPEPPVARPGLPIQSPL